MSRWTTWKVYLRGRHIDTVWFHSDIDAEEAKRKLVDHDGYHPNIIVEKEADHGAT